MHPTPLLTRVRRAIFQRYDSRQWDYEKTKLAYKMTLPRCPRCGTPCDGYDHWDDRIPICPRCDDGTSW